ncbi:MAG: hypothetical protein A2Y48_06320 [Nitrospirae bacterium RIFCSPLOW2_12_42_9]|nr:MAG: hypothetical protein A2035_04515 [Nitrospirae bacterium GWA2_42_11]OGW54276.1 MAG: hypothetical protein A2Z60_00975 [Nitrospirae bacterium RIFCSPLOWO2_02_42_7]OGW56292.1 MAG: hypothetical protein A3D21_07240 [Nitrospirae bacterium RIFCSPHIGHO2_02_FULL_42_12]OGW57348.1 MAG: hypothetical protein A2Y48_06320 [Nitrospirae bacterium RIFCSPLOW2_12_42_9]HBI23331.1 hypothetical protein [Nitrospiraceae bacterium]
MSLEKIKMLEERVSEVLGYIKILQKEKMDLEKRLQDKENELKGVQQQIEVHKKIEDDYTRMKDERGEIRSRVEKILDELKGIGAA